MKENHHHYFISLFDMNENYPLTILDIREKKISLSDIVEIEKNNKFLKLIACSEIECDCDDRGSEER